MKKYQRTKTIKETLNEIFLENDLNEEEYANNLGINTKDEVDELWFPNLNLKK